jgi:hypothetical protein
VHIGRIVAQITSFQEFPLDFYETLSDLDTRNSIMHVLFNMYYVYAYEALFLECVS